MKPKKSLGQNFLRNEKVLDQIIQTALLDTENNVLEIGPGEGILTEKLAEKAGKVIAIEKDDLLAKKLKSAFRNNPKVTIVHGDILGINIPEILKSNLSTEINGQQAQKNGLKYKVVANIPYYITSPIIQLFLETQYRPSEIILMVQKEVAERICGNPGNMSILAISVQYYAQPELLFYVNRESFWPVPEVDSAVIRLTLTRTRNGSREETKNFFRIVKAGFSAKRKTLANNLSSSLHLEKIDVERRIKKSGLEPGGRAQELSVEDWKRLMKEFD